MSQTEYIARIELLLPNGRHASPEALALVTEAIRAYPDSAELWLLHGWVTMQAADGDVADAAVRSFDMAMKISPGMAEAKAARDLFHWSVPVQPA